jgi:hypothetical protein
LVVPVGDFGSMKSASADGTVQRPSLVIEHRIGSIPADESPTCEDVDGAVGVVLRTAAVV